MPHLKPVQMPTREQTYAAASAFLLAKAEEVQRKKPCALSAALGEVAAQYPMVEALWLENMPHGEEGKV